MPELSEVFWTFVISSVCGIVLVSIRLCYKSKCKDVSCCNGLITINRDTDGEEKLDAVNPQRVNSSDNL